MTETATQETTLDTTLPDSWEWVSLDQLGEVIGGLTKNRKREVYPLRLPYLRVANVYANELRLDDVWVWVCPVSTDCLPLSHGTSSESSFLVL